MSDLQHGWLRITRTHRRPDWQEGIDARTGRPLRCALRDTPFLNDPPGSEPWRGWGARGALALDRRAEIRRAEAAEIARGFRSSAFLPILAIEPTLVIEAPPDQAGVVLTSDEVVHCLLQLLEVLAEIHDAGWAHQHVVAEEVGVERRDGRAALRIGFPTIVGALRDRVSGERAIRDDLRDAIALAKTWRYDHPLATRLNRVLEGATSAAEVARALVRSLPDAQEWIARVEAMPDVRELKPVATDWDRVISSLESDLHALRAHALQRGYDAETRAALEEPTAFQLAAALDQRARFALARGDLERASLDADRAIEHDDDPPYFVTRAVVRLEHGDLEGAWADADRAIEPRAPNTIRDGDITLTVSAQSTVLTGALLARVHLVRARVHHARSEHAAALDAIAQARAASDEPIIAQLAAASVRALDRSRR